MSVHCLAGSSFELEVNSGETGWRVALRIAAGVGHPAELLMLTFGGCVIDLRLLLLLHQVLHGEITYVVRKLGVGRVAMLWERVLAGSYVAALNKTELLTWKSRSSQQLTQGMQLPSSLRSLTFGREFNQSLRPSNYPAACSI